MHFVFTKTVEYCIFINASNTSTQCITLFVFVNGVHQTFVCVNALHHTFCFYEHNASKRTWFQIGLRAIKIRDCRLAATIMKVNRRIVLYIQAHSISAIRFMPIHIDNTHAHCDGAAYRERSRHSKRIHWQPTWVIHSYADF